MLRKLTEETNLYELLEISSSASPEEIKQAYRKSALKWHPDRNSGNVEEATRIFQLIEHAYSVLSNPQERDFYDQKFTQPDVKTFSFFDSKENAEELSDLGITDGYSDSKRGFFYIIGQKFFNIAYDEGVDGFAPTFGKSSAPWTQIRDFYNYWTVFSSQKDFSSAGRYLLDNAPNAQIRRAWTKENEKLRQKAKSEHNSKIRNLALKVKKIDPRVTEYIDKLERDQAERKENELRKKAAERSKIAKQFEQTNEKEYDPDKFSYLKEFETDNQNEEKWECEFCNRTMKDSRTFKTHCATKKHRKAASRARAQFFQNPENYAQTSYQYTLLGMTDEEIATHGDVFAATQPLELPEKGARRIKRSRDDQNKEFDSLAMKVNVPASAWGDASQWNDGGASTNTVRDFDYLGINDEIDDDEFSSYFNKATMEEIKDEAPFPPKANSVPIDQNIHSDDNLDDNSSDDKNKPDDNNKESNQKPMKGRAESVKIGKSKGKGKKPLTQWQKLTKKERRALKEKRRREREAGQTHQKETPKEIPVEYDFIGELDDIEPMTQARFEGLLESQSEDDEPISTPQPVFIPAKEFIPREILKEDIKKKNVVTSWEKTIDKIFWAIIVTVVIAVFLFVK